MRAIHYTDHAEFEHAMRARGFGPLLEMGLDPKSTPVLLAPALEPGAAPSAR